MAAMEQPEEVHALHSMFPSFTLVHLGEILRRHRGHMKRAMRAIKAEHKRNIRSQVSVAIVGGGIGGLALALALQRRGIRCRVFERDTCFSQRRQGYGLTMQQGASALRALGFSIDAGDNIGVHSTRHVVFTSDGRQVGEWGKRVWGRNEARAQPSKSNFHLPRQTLRKILLDALRPDTVFWDHRFVLYREAAVGDAHVRALTLSPSCRFISASDELMPEVQLDVIEIDGSVDIESSMYEKTGSKTRLWHSPCFGPSKPRCASHDFPYSFATPGVSRPTSKMELVFETGDGASVVHTADVVVGCDGINGSVRRQLIGESSSPLQYLGCIVVLGIASNLPNDSVGADIADGKTALQMSDSTTRIFAMPYDEKQTMWQLSFPMGHDAAILLSRQGAAALKDEALRRCAQWAAPVPQLLAATAEELVSGYPVYDRSILTPEVFSTESKGTLVTLLGDAAHPMSPFKGQGANQALADAVCLAREIYDAGDDGPASALRRYEAEMIARSATKVLASRAAAEFLHSELAVGEGNCTRAALASAR